MHEINSNGFELLLDLVLGSSLAVDRVLARAVLIGCPSNSELAILDDRVAAIGSVDDGLEGDLDSTEFGSLLAG